MMKLRISFSAMLVCAAAMAMAQKMNVESAYNYTRNNNFVKAKDAIDKAAENNETKNDPRMWFYRGKTYLGLWKDTTVNQADYPDAIMIAGNSFINCINTDSKKRYLEDARFELVNVAASAFSIASIAYNKGEYERSIDHFNLILNMSPFDTQGNFKRNNFADDVINQYLAYVYREKKDNAKSREYLQKLIDKNFNDPYIYTMMAEIVEEDGNKAKALEYIEQGRASYEDNRALLYEEIRLSLELNKTDALTKKFQDAIQLDPYNAQFHFYLGVLQEQSKDTLKAEASYRKAVELDNGNYDAMLSLGQLLFGRGYALSKALNNMDINTYKKDGARVEAEMGKIYDEALKYVEDCYALRPKDYDCLKTLKNLYTVKKRFDDVQRVDKEMKAVKTKANKE